MLDDVTHDGEIDRGVAVNEDVTESGHVSERRRQGRADVSAACEEVEQLAVGPRLTKALIRDDVRGDIERGLNRELQGMFDEPLLANVVTEIIGARETPKLRDVRFDLGQLLPDQSGVSHRAFE